MTLKAAIIIPNYNGITNLGGLFIKSIESALSIDFPRFDTVIVDNASTDDSLETIRGKFGKDIFLINLNKNYGYAGGLLFGLLRYSTSRGLPDYVVFMNNDYIITNYSFLNEIIKSMNKREDIGIAQGWNYIYKTKRLDNAGGFLDFIMQPIHRFSGLKDSECPEEPSYISYASGSCYVVKLKGLPEQILKELFDPKLFAYYDETDLTFRAWSFGIKTIAYPIIVGEHIGSATMKKTNDLLNFLILRNSFIIQRRTFKSSLANYELYRVLRYIPEVSIRMFKGYRGKLYTKALIEGAFKKIEKKVIGPYHPLVVVPKELKLKISLLIPHIINWKINNKFLYEYEQEYVNRLQQLTIKDKELEKLSSPFIYPF